MDPERDYRRRVPAQANAQALIDVLFATPCQLADSWSSTSTSHAPRRCDCYKSAPPLVSSRHAPQGPRGQHRWQADDIVHTLTDDT